MQRIEMIVESGADGILRLEIPVDTPNATYRVVVQFELVENGDISNPTYLSDDFINETAGKWDGDFIIEPDRDDDEHEPRLPPR